MIRSHRHLSARFGLALVVGIAMMPLAACGTLRTKDAETTQSTLVTFVDAPAVPCTFSTPASDTAPESLATTIFAPFAGELLKNAFDSAGAAIRAASEAKTENWATAPAPIYVARLEYDTSGVIPNVRTKFQRHCIRALIADILPTPPTPPTVAVTKANFIDPANRDMAVRGLLAPLMKNAIQKVHFYAEIELRPDTTNGLNQTYYVAQPVLVYYSTPVTDADFKLAAIRLDLNAIIADPTKPGWTYTFAMTDDPMLTGQFRSLDNDPLPASGLLPLPALTAGEISTLQGIQEARTKLLATYPAGLDPSNAAQLAQRDKLQMEVRSAQRAAEDAKCVTDGKGDQKVIDACKASLAAARALADFVDPLTLANSRKAQLTAIDNLVGDENKLSIGAYNASVTIVETRDANALGLAVAAAIASSKSARDTAVTSYVNSQLGVTPDASTTVADNTYRLARFDYDQAALAFEAAKAKGDAVEIASKQRTLIEKYNALVIAAEAVKQTAGVPPPY